MATQQSTGSDFTSNLGRVYATYTGGFVAFVLFLAVLEQVGVPNQIIGYLFVFFTILVYAMIGYLSRTMQVSEYYVAGRKVPAVYNGMATGADWMSAASFIGMAGTLYALGYDGLAFVLGWTGGYVLVAVLVAPYLRKFGAYTVPDFLGARYGGNFARGIGIVVLISCSFTYVVAQIYGTGIIASRFLGISFEFAVFVGLGGILLCSFLGGMRAVTWTQVAQYIVLIVAYLVPVVLLSADRFGLPIPQLTYGSALQQISGLEQQLASQGLAPVNAAGAFAKPHVAAFTDYDAVNYFALVFCLMVGTASLPHVLMRYFTTPSVREARISVAWSLLFIFLLYFTAPAYAAFAKLEVYQNVIGQSLSSLPNWIYTYGNLEGLVKVCGVAATDLQAVTAACGKIANHPGVLRLQDLSINSDVIVISTPEIAGLPYVIAGLVAAGGLAAALSTADGLLLAIANALSHDVYYRMIDKNAPTSRRLIIARALLLVVAAVAAWVASTKPADILAMVAWAFSLAAAGLFPALVLGIWWGRCNRAGAIAGMIAGFGITLLYLVVTRYYPAFGVTTLGMTSLTDAVSGAPLIKDMTAALASANPDAVLASKVGWLNIRNISAAIFGLPLGFAVMIVVSLMTAAPSAEMRNFISEIRRPRGKTLMDEKTA